MRLFAVLALLLAAPAASQHVPAWRVAADGGLTGASGAPTASLAAERGVAGGLSLGARVGGIEPARFLRYGAREPFPAVSARSTGYGEAFVSATHRTTGADLRASLGVGVAAVDYRSDPSGFCAYEAPREHECWSLVYRASDGGARPYSLAVAGVDVWLARTLGLGAEVRAAWMARAVNVSSVQVGARVRLGR